MSDIRSGLLDRIIESPNDDGPRLVYADWLMERVDPRGEFIMTQCALEKEVEGTEKHKSLKKREKELLKEYGEKWAQELGLTTEEVRFTRGFISQIYRYSNTLVPNELLYLVNELSIGHGRIRNGIVPEIVNFKYFPNLTYLDLSCNNIGIKGITIFAESCNFHNLTHFILTGNGIGNEGITAFAASRNFSNLTHIYLRWNNIGKEGIRAFVKSTNFPNLMSIDLYFNSTGDVGTKELLENWKREKEGRNVRY